MAARNNSGEIVAWKTDAFQSLRQATHSFSTTRSAAGVATSVVQRAAGEDEEDVLERAPTLVHRLGVQLAVVHQRDDLARVVRVHEHAIGQRLDALAELRQPRKRGVALLRCGEAQLDDLARRVLRDELARRALADD